MKKGVSLAIETIVFIILAVLVLTILLYFFTSQSGPAQQQVDLQRQRNQYCGEVVYKVPDCDETKITSDTELSGDPDKPYDKLKDVCDKLNLCPSGGGSKCAKDCCIFCPKVP
ncbi:MAG: hypothetical protein QMD85_03960 [Candidatus Aenigmarchaeota archaeon]|nr:hypothetical protein [Candidatus Aenigmarchaeota archaeon]